MKGNGWKSQGDSTPVTRNSEERGGERTGEAEQEAERDARIEAQIRASVEREFADRAFVAGLAALCGDPALARFAQRPSQDETA